VRRPVLRFDAALGDRPRSRGMSALSWKLQRLRAMPPAEIAHRTRIALRDRLRPPEYLGWSPAEAGRRLFAVRAGEALDGSRIGALLHAPRHPAGFEPALDEAVQLDRGEWTLFGRRVTLADPPEWRRNPLTGGEWPDLPSARIDYRRTDLAGGAKATWEVGRLTTLPVLALGARLRGEPAFAGRAIRWLDDWNARNPLLQGIHHTSGIEMAVRVLTVCATLNLLGDRAREVALEPCLGLLAQQALYCRDHLSLGSSANNHLIAEYAALAVMGGLFPALRGARGLLEESLRGLERETLRQIHPDGVPAEQAFGYLPFVWELLLVTFTAAALGSRSVAPVVRERLRASLEFARTVRLPDGSMPRIGDEDDGRVLLAAEGYARLDLVGNALAAWLGADALAADTQALALLLAGRAPAPARAAADGRHEFATGGYTVWRLDGLLVTFDHGPLGLGPIAAHGHADALAVTVHRGLDGVAIDPGTLAYHEDPEARARCRATGSHCTVRFGDRSQSRMLGPFLWGTRAGVSAVDGGYECLWADGERHWRRVAVETGWVTIEDRVEGEGAELVFALVPGARIERDGTRAVVVSGATVATFETDGAGDWRLEPAEVAPRYGARLPAARLVAPIGGERAQTVIRIAAA